jgi:lactose/raffinose/galactose permease
MEKKRDLKSIISYGTGAFGHDCFYATLSTYLIMFITSQLFNGKDSKYIVWITTLIFILRFVELLIDPLIGGTIDNTRTKMGKFKPWILFGGAFGSVAIIFLFSSLFGLSSKSPATYVVIFAIVYILLDIFYSFKDIGFWSMIPAISVDSREREKIGTGARIGSTVGQAAVMIFIVPIVLFFSNSGKTSADTAGEIGDKRGWICFAIIIAVVSLATALVTIFGTKENDNIIRKQEKSSLKLVFKTLFSNSQLMWLALSYGLLALAYVVTNSGMMYYFTYIVGDAKLFSICGILQLIFGFVSVALFPYLTKIRGRKPLYIALACCMGLVYIGFFIAGTNVVAVFVSYFLFFFPYPMMFLVALMVITDSVEYGQWKTGKRAESVTLSIRPLLDKLAGAISNGVIGFVAVLCAMTGSATASSVASNPSNILNFKLIMFGAPLIVLILSAIVFAKKIILDEKLHAKIVKELTEKAEKQSK